MEPIWRKEENVSWRNNHLQGRGGTCKNVSTCLSIVGVEGWVHVQTVDALWREQVEDLLAINWDVEVV